MKIEINIQELKLANEAALHIQHSLAKSHIDRKYMGQDEKFALLSFAMRVTTFFLELEKNNSEIH